MRHRFGADDRLQQAERAERDHVAAGIADVQPREIGGGGAGLLVGLQRHAKGSAEQVEVIDIERAQENLQRVEDVGDVEPQQLGLGAVEVVSELRRRSRKRREQLLRIELGLLARLRDQALRRVVERKAAAPGQVLDLEFDSACGAEAGIEGGSKLRTNASGIANSL